MLYAVLSAEEPEPSKAWAYYSLALRIDCNDALKAVAPQCVSAAPESEIAEMLKQMTSRELLAEEQIIEQAAAMKNLKLKQTWLKCAGEKYSYTYERLEALSASFGLDSSEAFDAFVEENFKEEYDKHRKEVRKQKVADFFSSVASVFSKKEKA